MPITRPRFSAVAADRIHASLTTNSAPVERPKKKRKGNHIQTGSELMAARLTTSMPMMISTMRLVPTRLMMRGRKGPAIRMPIGPMAELRPIAQAGQPRSCISSGISCSVRPKAMSQAPTVARAAMMSPVRDVPSAVVMEFGLT